MELEENLRNETEKWLKKINDEAQHISLKDKSRDYMVTNIHAYIKDAEIFLKENKLIMAFEAVLWAWAIYETMKELDIIEYS